MIVLDACAPLTLVRAEPPCGESAGGSISQHQRERIQCNECGGGGLCQPLRRRIECLACNSYSNMSKTLFFIASMPC